jgi:hypothetical protein
VSRHEIAIRPEVSVDDVQEDTDLDCMGCADESLQVVGRPKVLSGAYGSTPP